jgi:5-methylcytosine-specific restriction endonuclease McrA
MAEHVKSKVRHPQLRAEPTNLRPTCADCNRDKGSNDYKEVQID